MKAYIHLRRMYIDNPAMCHARTSSVQSRYLEVGRVTQVSFWDIKSGTYDTFYACGGAERNRTLKILKPSQIPFRRPPRINILQNFKIASYSSICSMLKLTRARPSIKGRRTPTPSRSTSSFNDALALSRNLSTALDAICSFNGASCKSYPTPDRESTAPQTLSSLGKPYNTPSCSISSAMTSTSSLGSPA